MSASAATCRTSGSRQRRDASARRRTACGAPSEWSSNGAGSDARASASSHALSERARASST
eukprot:5574863-Pleurochrysis_carterae.AAC.2